MFGRDSEFVAHRQNWGEDRVHLHDEDGELFSLPAGWTDVVPAALHARAAAFPLGLGVLTAKGVTAWRHALARLTCAPATGTAPAPSPAARPPGLVTTKFVHALAGSPSRWPAPDPAYSVLTLTNRPLRLTGPMMGGAPE